jgi:hypothetical protein
MIWGFILLLMCGRFQEGLGKRPASCLVVIIPLFLCLLNFTGEARIYCVSQKQLYSEYQYQVNVIAKNQYYMLDNISLKI